MITTIGIYISYHLLFRLITLDYERRSDIINCQLLILTSQNIFKWETWLNPSQDQKILATCLAGSFDFDKTFLSSFEFWLKKSVIPNQLQFYQIFILARVDIRNYKNISYPARERLIRPLRSRTRMSAELLILNKTRLYHTSYNDNLLLSWELW